MDKFTDCLYRDICDYDIPCKQACLRYSITKYLLENSNIAKNKWGVNQLIPDKCDIKAFEVLAEIRDNIVEFVNSGGCLYLYSNTCGNGKTTWAIKLMLQYFNDIWEYSGYNTKGIFMNVPTFLYQSKSIISKPDAEFENLRQQLLNVDLVIWDDIASNKMSNYDYDLILAFIDTRIVNGKANIFTGNIHKDDLYKYVGDRLSSRILSGAKIQLKGTDKRNGSITNLKQNIDI